jgi:putative ATP-binding cassette transporter
MNIKKLSDLFWETAPNLFFLSILLNLIVGLSNAMLIPFLLGSIDSDLNVYSENIDLRYDFVSSPVFGTAVVFSVAILSILLFKTLSMFYSAFIGRNALVKMRIDMCEKINKAPTVNLESLGQAKLINLLNLDIPRVVGGALVLPQIWVCIITILGVLGYIFYINTSIFILIIVSIVVGVSTYQIPLMFGSKYLKMQREEADNMQAGCRGLILGSKELKLDNIKCQKYLEQEIIEPEIRGKKFYMRGVMAIHFGRNYGDLLSMMVTGVVVFYLSYEYRLEQTEVFAIVMALLYLAGPISIMLGAIASLELAKISMDKINDFYISFEEEGLIDNPPLNSNWEEMRLTDIGFSYPSEENSFAIHSINMTLRKGEVAFIVGGNGSGKSTLSKVITTHYKFSTGNISFDEQSFNDVSLVSIRDSISTIYTDFYAFPSLYKKVDDIKANRILKYLELDSKVDINNGRFSTTALSDGQRKRLALLTVLLDDRPICLFDEWAADQDPRFKEIFYHKILPELRAQKKLVIVISHDDRHFNVADQVIVMEDGTVREIKRENSQLDSHVLGKTG